MSDLAPRAQAAFNALLDLLREVGATHFSMARGVIDEPTAAVDVQIYEPGAHVHATQVDRTRRLIDGADSSNDPTPDVDRPADNPVRQYDLGIREYQSPAHHPSLWRGRQTRHGVPDFAPPRFTKSVERLPSGRRCRCSNRSQG